MSEISRKFILLILLICVFVGFIKLRNKMSAKKYLLFSFNVMTLYFFFIIIKLSLPDLLKGSDFVSLLICFFYFLCYNLIKLGNFIFLQFCCISVRSFCINHLICLLSEKCSKTFCMFFKSLDVNFSGFEIYLFLTSLSAVYRNQLVAFMHVEWYLVFNLFFFSFFVKCLLKIKFVPLHTRNRGSNFYP